MEKWIRTIRSVGMRGDFLTHTAADLHPKEAHLIVPGVNQIAQRPAKAQQ